MINKEYLNTDMVNRFKYRLDNNLSIRYSDMKKEDSQLLFYIEKKGGVTKWAEMFDITKEELVKFYGFGRVILDSLSEKQVLDRLDYLKSIGKLTTNAMRTEFEDLRLENYLKRNYGSVKVALETLGYQKDTVVIKKDDLISKIKHYSDEGIDLCYTNMMDVDCTLVHNSTNKFGIGWNALLDKLGIEFTPMDRIKSVEQGLMFEKEFKNLLDIMNIKYIYNKNIDASSRPDFQLENNILLDCKLSAWTNSIPYTIDKYIDKCDKLIIVFLRGEYRHLEYIDNTKVEYRKIEYYYPYLESINRHDVIDNFNNILNYEK